MGDLDLKALVEAAIASLPELSGQNVGTEVFDGRVFLVGEVDTLAQETGALVAAKGVPGIREVLSSLRVKETEPELPTPIDDANLQEQIEAALTDHGLAIEGRAVTVSGGEVYLRGRVSFPIEKTKAGRLALTIKGVQAVHNEIVVAGAQKGKG